MVCDGPVKFPELREAELERAGFVGEEGGTHAGDNLGDVFNWSGREGWKRDGFGLGAHGE